MCMNMKIAVVGAGVAGLSVAWSLARNGVSCTVFDRLAEPGAALTAGSWLRKQEASGAHQAANQSNDRTISLPNPAQSRQIEVLKALDTLCPGPAGKPGALTTPRHADASLITRLSQRLRKQAPSGPSHGSMKVWLQPARDACLCLLKDCPEGVVELSMSNEVQALLCDRRGRVQALRTERGDLCFDAVVVCTGAELPYLVKDVLSPRAFPALSVQWAKAQVSLGSVPRPKQVLWERFDGLRASWLDKSVQAEMVLPSRMGAPGWSPEGFIRLLRNEPTLREVNWDEAHVRVAQGLVPHAGKALSGPVIGRRVWLHGGVSPSWEDVVLQGNAVALNILGRSREIAPALLQAF